MPQGAPAEVHSGASAEAKGAVQADPKAELPEGAPAALHSSACAKTCAAVPTGAKEELPAGGSPSARPRMH